MKQSRNASIALTGGQADKISEYKANGERKVIMVTNLNAAGGANVFVSVGEEAAANKGIQLQPGQTVTFSKDSGYTPSNEAWFAYTAAAGTTLAVYEEVEV